MRPPGSYGEVRSVLIRTMSSSGPLTIRAAAAQSQVGLTAARQTIANAVRTGAVRECGQAKPARGTRWETVYEVTPEPEPSAPRESGDGWFALAGVMGDWVR